ncbi:Cobalamin biosynthesis protein CobT [Thiohalospira halophila DSM 15071]|uniref:Cobalamin biosynthesis protein CobT n=1 Tax=Thiohalospira halophila DSM 15071 TaxID=1123397 RepID=A0A1I1N5Q3_9GAMM|nr:VWA domain-containing protein [Thiohalospira halophila]SFC92666.1 Cobalamin biosynthesis protein CobT [Thiohalospira halophila DSM 15071]
MRSVFDAFPIVAAAMGEQRGVRITQDPGGAWTTGTTINVPPIKDEADPGLVRKAWGFLDHESAHVLLTDFPVYQQWARKVGASLINIVEDIRIEAALIGRYPGARRNLDHLCQCSVDDGSFEAPSADLPVSSLVLGHCLYRGRSRGLGQSALDGYAAEIERLLRQAAGDDLVDKLNEQIDRAPAAATTDEAGWIAFDIYRLLQDTEEQQDQPSGGDSSDAQSGQQAGEGEPGDASSESDEESDSSDGAGDSAGGSEEGTEEDAQEDTQGGSDGSSEEGNGSASASGDEPGQEEDAGNGAASGSGADSQDDDQGQADSSAGSGSGGEVSLDGLLQAIKEADPDAVDITAAVREALNAAKDGHDNMLPEMAEEGRYLAVPDWLSAELKADAKTATLGLRKRLQGLLEAQARTRKTHSRSGRRLDARRVHRLKVGDTRLFERKRSEQGVNTAISILVDASGSMADAVEGKFLSSGGPVQRINLACQGAWSVTEALKGAKGVSTGVIAFGSQAQELKPLGQDGKYRHGPFVLQGGSTWTDSGVMRAMRQLLPAREDRKILLVLTDGDPNDPWQARDAFRLARQSGVETLVLGIGELRLSLGADEEAILDDISQLPQTMLRMLERRLKAA